MSAPFVRFLDVLLPDGGYVVVEVESYFDESGSHDDSALLCVAGYIIEKNAAIKLTDAWRAVLTEHKIPYFRMSDCAHGNGPFKGMTKQHRLEIEVMMIGIIKRYTACGLAVTVNSDEFTKQMPKHRLIGGPYTFCAHVLIGGIGVFIEEADKTARIDKMAYFFEAGHGSRSETDRVIREMFRPGRIRDDYRYSGHAFVLKEQTPAVQAADLLAWQWYTDKRHQTEGRPRRKDCDLLLEHPHRAVHIDSERIAETTKGFFTALKEQGVSEERAFEILHYGAEE